jgi:RNA recognition motif-containing protein
MRIYVGGLSYSVNDEGLRTLFSEFGNVADASVVSDRYSGQSKGFGFVEMPDDNEARAAISRLNGTAHFGRSLTVNEARPREERSGGGYGGGGGGRRW